ncbi:ena/VASP-like protein isoform X2 [Ornithodoros turicata]|uniref:ena/VASP-like protein isoform X2 n=1 Tax=Ornithodoros turicata TaxID=34597 RepID=UPI00313A1459
MDVGHNTFGRCRLLKSGQGLSKYVSCPSLPLLLDSEQSVAAVRASVLVYDDHNKKWVPSGSSSGLSRVHIYQHTVNGTFRVVGRKLQDHEVVINCSILKGLKYSQATATFHQWRDNRTVYGLNFSSTDDADTFAAAMLRAIEMLNHNSSQSARPAPPPPVPQHQVQPIYQTIGSVTSSQDEMPDHQRGWQTPQSQQQHYMSTNAVGNMSHPASPACAPPAPPQPPPQPPVAMGHHRTSSAPSNNLAQQQPVASSSVPQSVSAPPAPPPPPAPTSMGGGPPPPPPPMPPSGGADKEDKSAAPMSLAAALAGAKLKKTSNKIYDGTEGQRKSSQGGSSAGVPTMASMMDEMKGTLARRRAQAENSHSQLIEVRTAAVYHFMPDLDQEHMLWPLVGINQHCNRSSMKVSLQSANGKLSNPRTRVWEIDGESSAERKNWEKQGTTNGNSPSKAGSNGAESPRSGRGQRIGSLGDIESLRVNGVEPLDLEKFKNELLNEFRKEANKLKQDIIEAIRMELNRR